LDELFAPVSGNRDLNNYIGKCCSQLHFYLKKGFGEIKQGIITNWAEVGLDSLIDQLFQEND
jgi:hypothetical protein